MNANQYILFHNVFDTKIYKNCHNFKLCDRCILSFTSKFIGIFYFNFPTKEYEYWIHILSYAIIWIILQYWIIKIIFLKKYLVYILALKLKSHCILYWILFPISSWVIDLVPPLIRNFTIFNYNNKEKSIQIRDFYI